MAEAQQLVTQLSASVTSVFAALGSYLALITRNNPHGTSRQLYARPDVEALTGSALDEARDSALAAVEQAWGDEGGPAGHAVLGHLLNDVERAYSPRLLRAMVRAAYLSVTTGQFVPGITPPGANPAMESAQQRAQAVQDAVTAYARRALHRNALSIDVAAGHARTEAQLAEARSSGKQLYKRWRAHTESATCCHWCRGLDGVTIPLDESFIYYIGPAVDLSGHGHLTHPPRPYKNRLPGPKLHPNCRCWLEIVPEPTAAVPPGGSQEPPAPLPGFLAASEIRAMPEEKYGSLLAFLRAATHELGHMLRRLAGRG